MTREELLKDYYTIEEVAMLLGISVATLRNRHSAGKNHPPRTPERLYPKDKFREWNNRRLQYEISKAS